MEIGEQWAVTLENARSAMQRRIDIFKDIFNVSPIPLVEKIGSIAKEVFEKNAARPSTAGPFVERMVRQSDDISTQRALLAGAMALDEIGNVLAEDYLRMFDLIHARMENPDRPPVLGSHMVGRMRPIERLVMLARDTLNSLLREDAEETSVRLLASAAKSDSEIDEALRFYWAGSVDRRKVASMIYWLAKITRFILRVLFFGASGSSNYWTDPGDAARSFTFYLFLNESGTTHGT